jgi:ferrous iron transport protein B
MNDTVTSKQVLARAGTLRWDIGENVHDTLIESLYKDAARIADKVVMREGEKPRFDWDRTLDRLLTSRWTGFPIMLLILAAVFWVTISGANVPSAMIASFLIDTLHPILKSLGTEAGLPDWINGLLFDGTYLAGAWVVSVMLPPMAIFFPLFTLLEDFGYLPRVAFNLDNLFRKAGAHGKQALTMSMGYGCNAAGIIATRVIDSPRERLIAIITNNFALCNGRWPTQILIASLFIGALAPAGLAGLVSASAVITVTLIGIALTFLTSWVLSKTVLRGEVSMFSLELPPYRPPQILKTLYTSLIDRTIFVLWRAVVFAVPAGAVIWLISNITVGGTSIAQHMMSFMDPFGILIGLNGVILLAYIIAIPANEIVIPTILMLTVLSANLAGVGEGAGVMFELEEGSQYLSVLSAGGWTLLTAVNLMLFSLVHNPCSTTLYTIYKETGSMKWTAVSGLLPVFMGFIICFLVAQVWRILS